MGHNRGRTRNAGSRGCKHRKVEVRKQRIHDIRLQETRIEHDKRRKLAEWIEPRFKRLCELSSVGIVVEENTVLLGGKYPRESYVMKLCAEGHVDQALWKVDVIEVQGLTRWHDLSSLVLANIKKSAWKPLWPKGILDRLGEVTG